MEQKIDQKIRKEGAMLGLWLGIITAILSVCSFYLFAETSSIVMAMAGPSFLSVFIPFVIAIFLTVRFRSSIGGYWAFRQAMSGIFVMLLVAMVVSTLITTIFTTYIEPTIQERLIRNVANNTITFMENQGVPDEQIDEVTAKLDQQIEDAANVTIGQQIKGFLLVIIFTFVVALILAAIFKRDKPIFAGPEEPDEVAID